MPSSAVKLKPFPSTKLHRGPHFYATDAETWMFFSRNVKTFVKPASPLNHKDLKLFTFLVENSRFMRNISHVFIVLRK